MTGEKGGDAKGRGRGLTKIQSRHSSGAEEKLQVSINVRTIAAAKEIRTGYLPNTSKNDSWYFLGNCPT